MNTERELRFALRSGRLRYPKRNPARIRDLRLATLALALLMTGIAAADERGCLVDAAPHAEPGALFETVEAAAVDALAHAHHTLRTGDRGRLLLGTIYRFGDAYSYTEPMRSQQTVWASRPPVLRYALRSIDVASYVVHPPSGSSRIDRANERPNASQRRIVDELDPRGRPLFVLTPSRRIVRYADRTTLELVALPEAPPSLLVALSP